MKKIIALKKNKSSEIFNHSNLADVLDFVKSELEYPECINKEIENNLKIFINNCLDHGFEFIWHGSSVNKRFDMFGYQIRNDIDILIFSEQDRKDLFLNYLDKNFSNLNLEVKNHNPWYIFKLNIYKDVSIEFNYFSRSKRDYAFSNVGRVCGMNQCMIIRKEKEHYSLHKTRAFHHNESFNNKINPYIFHTHSLHQFGEKFYERVFGHINLFSFEEKIYFLLENLSFYFDNLLKDNVEFTLDNIHYKKTINPETLTPTKKQCIALLNDAYKETFTLKEKVQDRTLPLDINKTIGGINKIKKNFNSFRFQYHQIGIDHHQKHYFCKTYESLNMIPLSQLNSIITVLIDSISIALDNEEIFSDLSSSKHSTDNFNSGFSDDELSNDSTTEESESSQTYLSVAQKFLPTSSNSNRAQNNTDLHIKTQLDSKRKNNISTEKKYGTDSFNQLSTLRKRNLSKNNEKTKSYLPNLKHSNSNSSLSSFSHLDYETDDESAATSTETDITSSIDIEYKSLKIKQENNSIQDYHFKALKDFFKVPRKKIKQSRHDNFIKYQLKNLAPPKINLDTDFELTEFIESWKKCKLPTKFTKLIKIIDFPRDFIEQNRQLNKIQEAYFQKYIPEKNPLTSYDYLNTLYDGLKTSESIKKMRIFFSLKPPYSNTNCVYFKHPSLSQLNKDLEDIYFIINEYRKMEQHNYQIKNLLIPSFIIIMYAIYDSEATSSESKFQKEIVTCMLIFSFLKVYQYCVNTIAEENKILNHNDVQRKIKTFVNYTNELLKSDKDVDAFYGYWQTCIKDILPHTTKSNIKIDLELKGLPTSNIFIR
ncbi:MAG: hypothetical protein CMP39_03525 [Rickettsiales bacterium]|nr:hypothetical protein [Rickettsiales bacterium]